MKNDEITITQERYWALIKNEERLGSLLFKIRMGLAGELFRRGWNGEIDGSEKVLSAQFFKDWDLKREEFNI